jgi:small subunit ribosomal protein S6
VRRDYELGFILNPEVSEEQTRAILERIERIVSNYDGQVVRVNQWGRRRLAYPIKHYRDGNYLFIDMILAPETVLELDRTLKVSEEVLRHLIKRRDSKAVQKEREERQAQAAAAAAQAQAPAAAAPEPEPEAEVQAPVGAQFIAPASEPEPEAEVQAPVGAQFIAPASEPEPEGLVIEGEEEPIVLSPEEIEYVPPAIEEDSIEA